MPLLMKHFALLFGKLLFCCPHVNIIYVKEMHAVTQSYALIGNA